MKKTYWEKLQDPRWQKKRLETMEAKEFCCELCGDSESTLNVHHKEYFKDHEPWEYTTDQLTVLCEKCHQNLHSKIEPLKLISSFLPVDGPFDRDSMAILISGFWGIDYKTMLKLFEFDDMTWIKNLYESGTLAAEKAYAK
jgi:hypothetical protein